VTAAIAISDVHKRFRLVHERNSSIKAMVMRGMRRVVYEEFWALRGVEFDIPEGQTFGLIGRNGSGKSTLLKCMARIYVPDRGTIALNGSMSALLELGAGFHPELSGRENVYLNGSILGLPRREIDRRFDDIVSFAGLERFIDQPVKNYSSGMFVRLGFSVAINVEPDILLVDEVLAVGDETFQRRCMERFAQLRREGRTVVVVTHSLDTVRNICDQAAWLDAGVLQSVGPATSVVADYLDRLDSDRPEADPAHLETERAAVRSVGLRVPDIGPTMTAITGAPLEVDIDLERRTTEPMRLIASVHRTDGMHLSDTRLSLPPSDVGVRRFTYRIDSLDLRPGDYELSVKVTDDHSTEIFAEQRGAVRFNVTGEPDGAGLVSLGGRWSEPQG
jgi:ABC-2 type transport system ATP-binding protein